MPNLDQEAYRRVQDVFEEVTADFPNELNVVDRKIVLATELLKYAASGDTDRERLRSVAVCTVQRLQLAN